MTRAVIFDIDGALFDTEKIHMVSWPEVMKKHKFALTFEEALEFRGLGRNEIAAVCKAGMLGWTL